MWVRVPPSALCFYYTNFHQEKPVLLPPGFLRTEMHLVALVLGFLPANGEQITVAAKSDKPRVPFLGFPQLFCGKHGKMGVIPDIFVSGNVS